MPSFNSCWQDKGQALEPEHGISFPERLRVISSTRKWEGLGEGENSGGLIHTPS